MAGTRKKGKRPGKPPKKQYEVGPAEKPPTGLGGRVDMTLGRAEIPPPEIPKINLTGGQKSARLLLALGPEHAGHILRELDQKSVERLANEMARIQKLSTTEKKEILDEFNQRLQNPGEFLDHNYNARDILRYSLGEERTDAIYAKVDRPDTKKDFHFLERVDPALLATALTQEHPQIAAVALASITPKIAAAVMKNLPGDVGQAVALRIARTTTIYPGALQIVGRVLREKFENRREEEYAQSGGAEALAGILNHMGREAEDNILDVLGDEAPDVLETVRDLLYSFEELAALDLREMRLLLSTVNDDIIVSSALRGAGEEIRRHFFNAMSQNRATDILAQTESRGPISIREINEARSYLLNIARRLDEEGDILIKKHKEDYV